MLLNQWMNEFLTWYASVSTFDIVMLSVGFTGQLVFGSRFIVQWIVSERKGRSVIPTVFWYLSIVGSLLLFTYATYRIDPVFMLGQGAGCFIYVRNLILLEREEEEGLA